MLCSIRLGCTTFSLKFLQQHSNADRYGIHLHIYTSCLYPILASDSVYEPSAEHQMIPGHLKPFGSPTLKQHESQVVLIFVFYSSECSGALMCSMQSFQFVIHPLKDACTSNKRVRAKEKHHCIQRQRASTQHLLTIKQL